MKKITLLLTLIIISKLGAFAQLENPVTWSYGFKKLNKTEAVIFMKASVDEGWHIYSQNIKPGGPNKTLIKVMPSKDYTLVGKTLEPKAIVKFEKVFNMNVSYFEDEVVFQQKIKLNKPATMVKGTIEFMVCNDKQCLPPSDVAFSIAVK